MLKLRKPWSVYMPKLARYTQAQFSSDVVNIDDDVSQKVGCEQNKIQTEKFMKDLPHIKVMNASPNIHTPSDKQLLFTSKQDFTDVFVGEGEGKSPLSNVTGSLPPVEDLKSQNQLNTAKLEERAMQPEDASTSCNVEKSETKTHEKLEPSSTECSLETSTLQTTEHVIKASATEPSDAPKSLKSTVVPVPKSNPPEGEKESSVFMVTTKDHPSSNCVDLSTALLPRPLQYKESNLIVASVVQDVQSAYSKTATVLGQWHSLARSQGRVWYMSVDEFLKQPGSPQSYVREEAITKLTILQKKTSALLCEVKPVSDPKKPAAEQSESLADKVKAIIEKLTNTIKQKLAERGQAQKDKK